MESKIHYGIKCHECQTFPITGIRFKCLQCESYDLCEQCEEKFGKNHGHILLKLRNSNQFDMYQKKNNIQNNNPKQSESILPTFKCENPSLNFKTVNNNNFINIPVKLLNNGKTNWPLPLYFTCQEENSKIKGKKVKIIKCNGNPGEKVDFNVKLDLTNINKSGNYISVWCLQDENGVPFGPKIIFKVNDVFEDKLKLKPFYCVKKFDSPKLDYKPISTEELLSKRI